MDPQKVECIRADVRASLFNRKVIAFPIATRLAWHASGTFERSSMTGGSDGATMRFEPDCTEDRAGYLIDVLYCALGQSIKCGMSG